MHTTVHVRRTLFTEHELRLKVAMQQVSSTNLGLVVTYCVRHLVLEQDFTVPLRTGSNETD